MPDRMFAELLGHPGVEEDCILAGRFGFLAFHGGSLEVGTDVIASAAARRSGASLYAVRQPEDLRWHLPSVEFDPEVSPALASFVAHVDAGVALHGYGRENMFTTLLLGGRNRPLAATLKIALNARLDHDFAVLDDLELIPEALRGQHPDNPVNRLRHGGVQLELPPRVRPGTGAPTYRAAYERAVVDALVEVATAAASPAGAMPSRSRPRRAARADRSSPLAS
jgi:phage replication-related protein YjqB (UPF0714/DUF867 family)